MAKVTRLRKEQGTEEDKVKERHMEGTRKVKGKCYEHHTDEDCFNIGADSPSETVRKRISLKP